jgi:Flp pilus assembly protein TadB
MKRTSEGDARGKPNDRGRAVSWIAVLIRKGCTAAYARRMVAPGVFGYGNPHSSRGFLSASSGNDESVIWLYVLLAIVVAIAIWLAIVVIKWLFILAVVAALIWLILALRRRVAH